MCKSTEKQSHGVSQSGHRAICGWPIVQNAQQQAAYCPSFVS